MLLIVHIIQNCLRKGRARSAKAFYCMLVSRSDSETCLGDMAQNHSIEQQLGATENFQDEQENLLDSLFHEIVEPYAPFGDEGPRVTLLSSISLFNRYIFATTVVTLRNSSTR